MGRCGKGLKCSLAHATFKNPVGYCVSVLKPTTAPVQKLLTKVQFFGAGSHDAVDLEQWSGVPRQNIPGVPISKVAESNLKKVQTLPESDNKYFVHTKGLWSVDSAKILTDTVQPKIGMLPNNATKNATAQNTTHAGHERRQKTVSKGTVINISSVDTLVMVAVQTPL